MTYGHIVDCLKDAGIENAETEAALLLEHFCGASRAQLFSSPDTNYESKALMEALDRRCEHYPLQYLFGEWDFFGETYFVNENCLIPRSDTECLVEKAISLLPQNAYFADLCTGSGCIAISVLKHHADCRALAADLFPETLNLAARNAERNGVKDRLSLVLADVLRKDAPLGEEKFDAILSNPPYMRTAIIDSLEEELFSEPRAALDGGADGLDFYRAILAHHTPRLKQNGFLLFEIGYDQKEDIEALAHAFGYSCKVENDLAGNPRTALLRKTV